MQSSDAFGTAANSIVNAEGDVRFHTGNGIESTQVSQTSVRSNNEKKRLAVELANFEMMAKEARQKLVPAEEVGARAVQVYEVAQQLFAAAPTWMAFYREILSLSGVAHELFAKDEMRQFEATPEFNEIQKMITVLRAGSLPENDPMESLRMITVRLPLSLHEALCKEAENRGVSVNQLCISRLLASIADEYLPTSSKGRRGRRPGPQGPRRDRNLRSEQPSIVEQAIERVEPMSSGEVSAD